MNAPDRILDGLVRDLPREVYFAHEAMSQSGAKRMIRSPMHYRLDRTQPSKQTEAMQFGTAVHDGVLEPDFFASRVVQAPEINRRTKDGKADWQAFCAANDGRIVLEADDMARVRSCVNAVRAHPAAMKLLTGAEVELSFFWRDAKYDVPCKARWDARNHGGVVDLKTTIDASPEGFARQAANLLYHMQEAQYRSAAEHVLNESPTFFAFICVESEPPHAVACYTLPPAAVHAGAHLMSVALDRYAKALAAGDWPGYSPTIDVLPFPSWALRFAA